jgi:hypothetical protein
MTKSGLVVTILFVVYENVAPILKGTTSFEYFGSTQLKDAPKRVCNTAVWS